MPEYLAPGVFVEEVSFRSKSIEGVGTSVAAIAGPTRFGPVRGAPEVVTSYNEFERIYGDPGSLKFGDEIQANYTALAARAFFENGGKQLYVARVVRGGNETDASGNGSSSGTAKKEEGGLAIEARFPGSGGNFDVEVIWEDSQNLLKRKSYTSLDGIEPGSIGMLEVKSVEKPALQGEVSHDDSKFPLIRLRVLAKKTDTGFEFIEKEAQVTNAPANEDAEPVTEFVPIADLGIGLNNSDIANLVFQFSTTYVGLPVSGVLTDETQLELVLNEPSNISKFTSVDLEGKRRVRGTVVENGSEFKTSDNKSFSLAALAITPSLVRSLHILEKFSIDVIRRKITALDEGSPGKGEVIFRAAGLSLDINDKNFVGKVLPHNPEKKLDGLTQPIAVTVAENDPLGDLFKAFDQELLNPEEGSFDDPRYVITLENGTDGDLPIAIDYAGETDEQQGSTGLAALEEIEDISIVLTPAAAADPENHQAVVSELQKHCAKMRYRVGLVDSRENMSLGEVRAFRDNFDDSRLVLYTPWVVTSDPTGQAQTVTLPPSGFMAGIYARTDVEFGVHKAPANTAVLGALRFNQDINKFQQELLNPYGINCLRSFSGRGHRVWGARTLSGTDPEWKYVNVRRYFLYLERSIDKGTQWAVFEPNGEKLWANVVTTVESFLFNEWKNGRLLGGKPASAYFVRCDRSTMTQNDIDNGRLVCEVGVAPLRPAEFVVFRIGQKTADA